MDRAEINGFCVEEFDILGMYEGQTGCAYNKDCLYRSHGENLHLVMAVVARLLPWINRGCCIDPTTADVPHSRKKTFHQDVGAIVHEYPTQEERDATIRESCQTTSHAIQGVGVGDEQWQTTLHSL